MPNLSIKRHDSAIIFGLNSDPGTEENPVELWDGTTFYTDPYGYSYPSSKSDKRTKIVGPGTPYPKGFNLAKLCWMWYIVKKVKFKVDVSFDSKYNPNGKSFTIGPLDLNFGTKNSDFSDISTDYNYYYDYNDNSTNDTQDILVGLEDFQNKNNNKNELELLGYANKVCPVFGIRSVYYNYDGHSVKQATVSAGGPAFSMNSFDCRNLNGLYYPSFSLSFGVSGFYTEDKYVDNETISESSYLRSNFLSYISYNPGEAHTAQQAAPFSLFGEDIDMFTKIYPDTDTASISWEVKESSQSDSFWTYNGTYDPDTGKAVG